MHYNLVLYADRDNSCDNNLTSLVPHAVRDNDDVSVLRVRLQTQCDQLVGAASLCDDHKALLCALGHVKPAVNKLSATATQSVAGETVTAASAPQVPILTRPAPPKKIKRAAEQPEDKLLHMTVV